jgi:hypothetical protein
MYPEWLIAKNERNTSKGKRLQCEKAEKCNGIGSGPKYYEFKMCNIWVLTAFSGWLLVWGEGIELLFWPGERRRVAEDAVCDRAARPV